MYQKYIVQIPKLIPQSICKKIISYFENSLEEAKITGGTEEGTVDRTVRNCNKAQIFPDYPATFGQRLCINYLQTKLIEATDIYDKQFPYNPMTKFDYLMQMDFLKYEKNKIKTGYSWHADTGRHCGERACTISISLNNEYVGGSFRIMVDNEEVSYTQNVGDCLMFPSNFMFPHQVEPITEGTRYALVAWVI